MIQVQFAPSFGKHVKLETTQVEADNLFDALDTTFKTLPQLRGYVFDDQGTVRHHVAIFINDATISDRQHLSDSLVNGDRVFVFQALSGG